MLTGINFRLNILNLSCWGKIPVNLWAFDTHCTCLSCKVCRRTVRLSLRCTWRVNWTSR